MSATRSRSLNGCDTCRARHIKCDERRPTCLVCQRFGLVCQGYQTQLLFIHAGDADEEPDEEAPGPTRYRRPLFTEEERRRISNDLQAAMGGTAASRGLSRVLSQLDEESQNLEGGKGRDAADIVRGPFAVFRIDQPTPTAPNPMPSQNVSVSSPAPPPAVEARHDALPLPMPVGEDHSPGDPLLNMALSEDISLDLFALLDQDFTMFGDPDLRGMSEDFSANIPPALPTPCTTDTSNEPEQYQAASHLMQLSHPLSIPPTPSPEAIVPEDAGFLLLHYKNNVIKLLSPLKYHRKTPWNILQLPCAMNTLAELTMGYHPNHAKTALFYALLAISAFNLTNVPSPESRSPHWRDVGESYRRRAHDCLKLALKYGLAEPKGAKYKEILMAMLSMVTLSAFRGDTTNTRSYLLDAERLIRLKGLPKPKKSRKLRLLHHCYSYLRIIFESTNVCSSPPAGPPGVAVTPSVGGDGDSDTTPFQPTPGFRIHDWTVRLDQRMAEAKNTDVGQNDVHLEIPGQWDRTLYPDIYGVPESFLSLLSQTARLGNERDILHQQQQQQQDGHHPSTSTSSASYPHLLTYAKAVEKEICRWSPSARSSYPSGGDPLVPPPLLAANRRVLDHLVRAMHQALLIYFYRRVHDVHPCILQPYVRAVMRHLSAVEEEDAATAATAEAREGGYTVGIVWPGFVAACEALDKEVQGWFVGWFERSARWSGLPTFEAARVVTEMVWRRREESADEGVTWMDVVRERGVTLLCT